jgi:hypothetical protein
MVDQISRSPACDDAFERAVLLISRADQQRFFNPSSRRAATWV